MVAERQPINDRYCFRLSGMSYELAEYISLLDQNVGFSPWFRAIALWTLINQAERQQFFSHFSAPEESFEGYFFALVIYLRAGYSFIEPTPGHPLLISRQNILQVKSNAFFIHPVNKKLPQKMEAQWLKLTELTGASNGL